MLFIGDSRCKYNALSTEIRCAVNPDGPCEGCQYFEPVRERIMSVVKPIALMSRRELLAYKLKVKIFAIWSVARYPVGMIQFTCTLTILGLLISNKYPISKELFLEFFSSDIRIVGVSYSLIREYEVLREIFSYGRQRTLLSEIFRVVEPLIWMAVIDSIAKALLKSP
jgi:Family of unknown function (DUF6464)